MKGNDGRVLYDLWDPARSERMSNDPSPPLNVLLTTDPGVERTVEEELIEKAREKGIPLPETERAPTGHGGTVSARFAQDDEEARELLFQLRSVHHVLKELDLFRLPDDRSEQLAAIRERIRRLNVPEFEADPQQPFRVSCDRLGHHSFSSMEVLQVAGAAVQERYKLPVDLEDFSFHFRVDLYEKACRIGLQWTGSSLSKRKRPFLPRIALKGNIAYSLLKTLGANTEDEGPLLDPFCGSGTILLEAARLHPSMQLYGSDNYSGNIPGTAKNLQAYGVRERVQLRELDARDLSEVHPPSSLRYIATNPPYGLRMGSGLNFFQLYTKFLAEAAHLLQEKGRMAILIMKKGLFLEVLEKDGRFSILEERELIMGRIHTWLYLLERA